MDSSFYADSLAGELKATYCDKVTVQIVRYSLII